MRKKDFYREDKPDYSTRAVTEALVNALIHRDYIVMGAEIHIDMYDDRLEITSPGGMYGGKPIQERKLDEIESERRNPVIADLFHRMKFMERRGRGIKKIIEETSKLPGYDDSKKPIFRSSPNFFTVILKSMNYNAGKAPTGQVPPPQVTVQEKILDYCSEPRSRREIMEHCGYKDKKSFVSLYLAPLLTSGALRMTLPNEPTSRLQKYVTTEH